MRRSSSLTTTFSSIVAETFGRFVLSAPFIHASVHLSEQKRQPQEKRIDSLSLMDRYVSSYELKEGLLKFGIGVSDEVADALLKDLGGATQFTALDLASFVGHVSEASSVRRVKPYQGKRPVGSNASENGLEHERIAPSHSRNDEVGGVRMPAVATPQQQGREHGAASGRTGEEEVSSDEVDSRPRSQTPSRKFRWDELPSWARKSSKRALQELMGHHQR